MIQISAFYRIGTGEALKLSAKIKKKPLPSFVWYPFQQDSFKNKVTRQHSLNHQVTHVHNKSKIPLKTDATTRLT